MSTLSQARAGAGLSAMTALLNGGALTFYDVPLPSSPETAVSSGSALASGAFSGTAFTAPVYDGSANMAASGQFANPTFSPSASGAALFARATTSGSVAETDYTTGSNWIASQAVVLDQLCYSSGNTYKCTTAGTSSTVAPSGTTTFTDGTVTWTYVGAGQLFDVLMGNVNLQVGTTVTVTLVEKIPAK